MVEHGRRFVRLVDPSELARLRAIYSADQEALDRLLASQNIRCVDLELPVASNRASGNQDG
jgi:hypothetical protein